MIASITAWIEAVMLTHWVYPLVGTLIFFDCFFPVLPSEIPLNMVGAWSGSQGIPHVPTMFFVAVVAALWAITSAFCWEPASWGWSTAYRRDLAPTRV